MANTNTSLYSVADVAVKIQQSKAYVRGLIDRGVLIAFPIGRKYKITEGDLAVFIERSRLQSLEKGAKSC